MTNYDRYLKDLDIELLAITSIYVTFRPDYDEGYDGEWYQCGNIEEWHTTLNKYIYGSYEEALEATITWLKAEESYDTLGCEMCVGHDHNGYNYEYSERCKDCIWYLWADENDPKNKDRWDRKV